MPDEIKNVFIPHIHEDDEGLPKLKDIAARHGLEIRDSSITSDKPNRAKNEDYIKQKILNPQIKWAGTVVVYVSPDTWKSEWVTWEIERAHKLGETYSRHLGIRCEGLPNTGSTGEIWRRNGRMEWREYCRCHYWKIRCLVSTNR